MIDWESCGVGRFNLGPLIQGQTRIAKLKSAYTFPPNPRIENWDLKFLFSNIIASTISTRLFKTHMYNGK